MQKYIQLKKGLSDYGRMIPIEDTEDKQKLNNYIKSAPKKDWYTSLYYFDEQANTYFIKNKGSIAGYKGKALSNKLVFDFDSSDNSEAQQDTITLLERLQKDGISILDNTRVFFSGNKGFHVEVPISESLTPEELKTVCSNLAEGLRTFDTVVYNTTRAYRLRDTINPKSGLYKIELSPNDLELSIEQIKEKAKKPSPKIIKINTLQDTKFLDKYKEEKKPQFKPTVMNSPNTDGVRGLDNIDFSKMPKGIPRCIYALEHGVMIPGIGERSEIFLRLAAYYRNQGYSKEKAYNSLKAVARLNHALYPEFEAVNKTDIYRTNIKSAYSDNWKQIPGASGIDIEHPIFKRYCDAIEKHTNGRCCLHSKSEKRENVILIEDAFDTFSRFAQNFNSNTIKTGIDFIDDYMKIAVGTTTMIAGASGSGKTTLCLNIIENANKLDQHCMFFSMDMHKNLVSLKLAQKLTNWTQDEIIRIFENKDFAKMHKIRDLMKQVYGKTYFDFSSSSTFDEMRQKVFDQEQKTGNKIKLVVVDYIGRIVSDKNDSYANAKFNALKSTEIAADTDAAWLLLSQISRNSGDGSSPLRTKRLAKDSGDWEDSCTNIISLWRPFLGAESFNNPLWKDDVMRIGLVKNRMGAELERPLFWDGAKGLVTDMTDINLQDYITTRETEEKIFYKQKYARE